MYRFCRDVSGRGPTKSVPTGFSGTVPALDAAVLYCGLGVPWYEYTRYIDRRNSPSPAVDTGTTSASSLSSFNMGKGYNNYMCKKFFHPTNFENIKRKWMAEQANEYDTKREAEKLDQYRREQETLENRVLLGDEKARLGLAWMYDQPAMMEKPERDDKEVRFEWQRKYSAPRESYCKNSSDIVDQPFAIEVRNVRCMRCRQWGHLNTDRVCPLYGQSFTQEPTGTEVPTVDHVRAGLQKEGLTLKRGTELERYSHILQKAKQTLSGASEESTRDEDSLAMEFLRNLSEKQREKLLKKLSSSSSLGEHKKHKKSHKHSKHSKHSRKH
ncbi:unnamed protein product [Fasciola hepatica]|uniref:CBF1-interacting co-repressor CIR N-terminal domain-containing protein n=1 Tax=Fasciola hepatica TaxID=6192 RepID=A0ABC9HIZ4_FASHE|nr:unnamed protein product [Fasciola hepatica]